MAKQAPVTPPPVLSQSPDAAGGMPAPQQAAGSPPAPASGVLVGRNPVRIINPNPVLVEVRLRLGNARRDFKVPANGVATVSVPDGTYDIYFVYADQPDALFQGDSFTVMGNWLTIRLEPSSNGNYRVRQVN